jgi:cytochrome c2
MSKYRNLLAATALFGMAGLSPALAQDFGLGRAALSDEIAAWDMTIMPNGHGLPDGSGSVLDGEELWVESCSACHGDFGEAVGNWPVIAGGLGTLQNRRPVKTVGSYWPYLSTVWDYVHRSMPFGNAQSLTTDDTYAIVAYILYSNNLVDEEFVLDHDSFADVQMPNVDGFYVDDRAATEYPLFSVDRCMSDCRAPVAISTRATDINVTPAYDQIRNGTIASDTGADEVEMPAVVEEAVAAPEVAALDAALVAAGEGLFRQCSACHRVGEGARNGAGPMLNGIVGATAGQVDGFRYSNALRDAGAAGTQWTAENLNAYLENPREFLPGNRMSFRGMRIEDDRAAVIAFLSSLAP